MREYTTPHDAPLPTTGNLSDDVVARAQADPGAVAHSRRAATSADGQPWTDVTAEQFLEHVRAVAKGLMASGVEPGDRVALLASTRYEWTVADYAVWFAGAVSVPIYETAPADQVELILSDSGAKAAIVEGTEQASRVRSADQLAKVWELPSAPADPDEVPLAELARLGQDVSDVDLERRRTAIGTADPATLIYTSGTTGHPKGCVLTHGSFMAQLDAATRTLPELFESDDAATLLVLPLAHVFARIVQVGAVRAGVRLGHTSDFRRLRRDLAEFQPTFLLGVPRVFEAVFNAASQEAVSEGRGAIFDRATDAAIGFSQALDAGRRPGPLRRAQHALFERTVYPRVRATFGGRCRFLVSGGAPLGERLGHYYRGIGVPVLEGYGLTETAGAVTVTQPESIRIGTVGRPLPGTTIRIGGDGELLVRGPQVMAGYWQDPDATASAISGSWLRTGDLGEIDDEGFVRVVGRLQEVLVTTGGKGVAPGPLEDRLRTHPLVDQCLVVGDGRPYVAALVTLDPDSLATWAGQQGKSKRSAASLATDPDLVSAIQAAVDDTNRTISQAESIRRFVILPEQWSEESGELTPTLKLRRHTVTRRYREQIAGLYDA